MFDPVSYLMGKASGGGTGGGGALAAAYAGQSYCYLNYASGGFTQTGTNETFMNVYNVTAGRTYLGAIGATVSNRLRAFVFYGETASDVLPYVTAPGSYSSPAADLNVFGTPYDPSDMMQRFLFTPAQDGVLMVATSNEFVTAPIYLVDVTPEE